jgi:hypothetical protein
VSFGRRFGHGESRHPGSRPVGPEVSEGKVLQKFLVEPALMLCLDLGYPESQTKNDYPQFRYVCFSHVPSLLSFIEIWHFTRFGDVPQGTTPFKKNGDIPLLIADSGDQSLLER